MALPRARSSAEGAAEWLSATWCQYSRATPRAWLRRASCSHTCGARIQLSEPEQHQVLPLYPPSPPSHSQLVWVRPRVRFGKACVRDIVARRRDGRVVCTLRGATLVEYGCCLLYTSPSPRDAHES
eukprot:2761390-Prymnesium_polylepis.2